MEWRRGLRYTIGTLVQRRDGYVFVKTDKGLRAEHRVVAEQRILNRPLRKGEVVIRRAPDRTLNAPSNLVVVQHSLERFKYLPHPNILYVPARQRKILQAA
jgi:hypothetical protein